MIYLYIGKNSIKLLSLSKTMLGQYNVSYFQKYHENDLLEDGSVKSVDILASAIKEALTQAQPQPVTDNNVYVVLPQESFEFARYDIPVDISESAIPPFIKDKARSEMNLNLDESLYNYLLVKQDGKAKVFFFAQSQSRNTTFSEVFSLLGLTTAGVVPETLCYFKLFEKTLRAEKKETIFYVYHNEKKSFGYIFDSFGLLKKDKYVFGADFEKSLKETVDTLISDDITLNRIILSGSGSEKFRQDLFTKNIGVWTNPLKKIVLNFYQDYLKMIIVTPSDSFPILDLDVCLGAFILHRENSDFMLKTGNTGRSTRGTSGWKPSMSLKPRDILIFFASFAVSFMLIFFFPRLQTAFNNANFKLPFSRNESPTPTPAPTVEPTETPVVEINKQELKIKVLNGVGTPGLASDVQEHLREKEYSDILTGNADTFDYEETVIQVKDDKRDAASVVALDLEDRVIIKEENIESLDEEETADIVLIVGNDFK